MSGPVDLNDRESVIAYMAEASANIARFEAENARLRERLDAEARLTDQANRFSEEHAGTLIAQANEIARLKAAIAEHKRGCQDGGPHLVDKDRALWSVLESFKE